MKTNGEALQEAIKLNWEASERLRDALLKLPILDPEKDPNNKLFRDLFLSLAQLGKAQEVLLSIIKGIEELAIEMLERENK